MSLENTTQAELAQLLLDMTSNAESRDALLPHIRKARPGLPIPELDLQDKIKAHTDAQSERIKALEDQLAKSRIQAQIEEGRRKVISAGLVDESEISDLEKLMTEKKIADHEIAARYRHSERMSATPTPSIAKFNANPFEDAQKTVTDYFKNPKSALMNDLMAGVRSMRGQR
jgi:Spy/CpxP family protein refolding chaperone